MGSLPRIFDGDRSRADAFLTELLGYLILNQGVSGFESPIRQVALALSLIKGEKVDLWVKNMIDSLRQLDPVAHNVPEVWHEFEAQFLRKFSDSTKGLRACSELEKLKFRYPDIDGYIAEFEDLVVKAGYDLRSQETFSLFLKGFEKNRGLLDKLFTPPVPTDYVHAKRRAVAVVKSMQLVNSIAQSTPNLLFQPRRPPP
jgi:hypothetical protein